MPAGRFVVRGEAMAQGQEIALPEDVAHQVRDVLRLGAGGSITLLDGEGGEWDATVTRVTRREALALVGERRAKLTEPRTRVVLNVGMIKPANFEWVLQKGTELGVATFRPLLSQRAVRGAEDMGSAKRARWGRILAEAAEQSFRTHVPELADPATLAGALDVLPEAALALVPWEQEHSRGLRSTLRASRAATTQEWEADRPEVHLFVGPEGGFSAAEVAQARARGAITVSLGPRILRAETAAIVAATLVLDAYGELG